MMNKFKCIVLLLGIIMPTAIGLANSGATKEKDGGCPVVINKSIVSAIQGNVVNGGDVIPPLHHSLYAEYATVVCTDFEPRL